MKMYTTTRLGSDRKQIKFDSPCRRDSYYLLTISWVWGMLSTVMEGSGGGTGRGPDGPWRVLVGVGMNCLVRSGRSCLLSRGYSSS